MIRNVTEHSVDLSRYIAISNSLRREEREREKNGVLKYIGDIKARFAAAADWTRVKQARKEGRKGADHRAQISVLEGPLTLPEIW